MTLVVPSLSQIKAKVAQIHQKVSDARVIGIHSPGRWTGDRQQSDGKQAFEIEQCDSPLAMRLALRRPVEGNATKVLITGLDEQELSLDILLRLEKRKLFKIEPWQIVRALFDAHSIDPRLTRQPWIAECLLDLRPPEGYPAARGGFLDAETVWPIILNQTIRLAAETPDLTSLLKWSLDSEATSRFKGCPIPFREGVREWLSEKAGPAAELVLGCIEQLDRPDAVPIGLAAAAVFDPAAVGKLEKATGKLEERFLGGKTSEAVLMHRWSAAATEVVRALRDTDSKAYRQVLQRADEILREIQADSFAYLSDVSPLGFDQRLARLGERLNFVLESHSWEPLDELEEAHRTVRAHDQSAREARRLERVDMALRLIRWLGDRHRRSPAEFRSCAQAAHEQIREGGFVDWARLSLRAGDPVRELSEAYSRLFDEARNVCERQAHNFAKLLVDWTAAGSPGEEVLPVERILDQIVAPLAADNLVLVIVIDGMSAAVCRELLSDLTRREWIALCESGRRCNRAGLATIPSVTEFSRTSLLCGRLRQGSSADEKIGFAEHPTLVARSRSGFPPVLFHKAGLQESEDAVLAADVRKEISSTHRRVVGVVVNAVDDHLLKGEQIDTRWSRDEIKVLPALLHEARIARRLVILVSDHGHVLDCQASGRPCKDEHDNGERWRAAEGPTAHDELSVEGSRVLTPTHRLIAPWSERVRYGMKKNGYHGGLTPQEMVVPIVVLASTDDVPKGWSEQPLDTPVWWDEPSPISMSETVHVPPLKVAKTPLPATLFDLEPKDEDSSAAKSAAVAPWILQLLSCPVFEDQKRLGGRGLPSDEVFKQLLSALDNRGGKLTYTALARTLEFPAIRLAGLLAKTERVLNVDGYDVLRRDDASDTVELNRSLLLKQFDLI